MIKYNLVCKCGKAIPSFGLPTDKVATCCSKCKSDDMINIKSKRCESCGLYRVTPNNHGVCVVGGCFERLYPEEYKNKKRAYLYIQTHFKNGLIKILGKYFDGYDKKIDGGCSLRRPDWYKDFLVFMFLMECDEHRHKSYICAKEFL